MDAANVILNAKMEGNRLWITEQLDRDLYNQAAKILAKYGAKWDRRAKAHVFPPQYLDAFKTAMGAGFVERKKTIQQEIGFFQTPEALAEDLCLAGTSVNKARVLEPNGGHGRIIYAALKHGAAKVVTAENYPPNVEVLQKNFSGRHDVTIIPGDFLEMRLEDLGGQLFDAVIANPPFAQGQDIDHIMHASQFVKRGGCIRTIMSAGILANHTGKYTTFKRFLASHDASVEELPHDTFKEEGTMVHTVKVYIHL